MPLPKIGVWPKAAIERAQSQARFCSVEREQARASLIYIRQHCLISPAPSDFGDLRPDYSIRPSPAYIFCRFPPTRK